MIHFWIYTLIGLVFFFVFLRANEYNPFSCGSDNGCIGYTILFGLCLLWMIGFTIFLLQNYDIVPQVSFSPHSYGPRTG